MSFTNKTPNYNLPQWLGSDKPAWLTDMNGAFSAIDTAIKGASDSGSSAEATANNALSTAQSAQETASEAATLANEAKVDAGNATTIANNASQQAGTALTAVNLIKDVGQWKWIRHDGKDITINGYTKTNDLPTRCNFMFYNKTLNLMQLSPSLKVEYVTTSIRIATPNGTNESCPTMYDYPLFDLPFSCTGSLTIAGLQFFNTYFFGGVSSGGANTIPVYGCSPRPICIKNYKGKAWVHIVDVAQTNAEMPAAVYSIQSPPIWFNCSNLGEITLDGWQDMN